MKLLKQGINVLWKGAVILLVAGFSLVMFSPNVLARYLQAYANRVYLNPVGYRLSYGDFEGDFLGTMRFGTITIAAKNGGPSMTALNTGLNFDLIRLLRRDLSFEQVGIESLTLRLPAGKTQISGDRFPIERLPWVSIQDLTITSFEVDLGGERLWFRLAGDLELKETLRLDDVRLEIVSDVISDTLYLAASRLEFDGKNLAILSAEAAGAGHQLALVGNVQLLPEIEFDLRAAATQVGPLPLLPGWLTISGFQGRISGPVEAIGLDISLEVSTQGRSLDRAEVNLVLGAENIILTRGVVALGTQEISMSGELNLGGAGYLRAEFINANPSRFVPNLPDLTLNGAISVGVGSGSARWDSLDVSLDMNSLAYDGRRVEELQGAFSKRNQQWIITDTISARLDGGDIQLWGQVDEVNRSLDLEVYLQADALDGLLETLKLPAIGGTANGQMWISGNWDAPSLTGALMLGETTYGKLRSGQSFVQFVIDSVGVSSQGRMQASMGDLDLFGVSAEGAELEMILSGDTLRVNYLRIYQNVERLATSGYAVLKHPYALVMDTLSVTRNTEPLASGPLEIRESPEGPMVLSHRLDIAGGSIAVSGWLSRREDFVLELDVDSLDLERFYRFLGKPPAYRGNFTSDLRIGNHDNRLMLDGNFHAVDGAVGEIPFKDLRSSFTLDDATLNLHNLDWTGRVGSWQMNGEMTYSDDPASFGGLGPMKGINITGDFDHYQFHEMQSVMPWVYETAGLLTGKFTATGSPDDPHYVADFSLSAPRFDLITGERLSSHLDYQDERLTFTGLEMRTASGHYTGGGYLPVDLRPTAPEMKVLPDKPVDLLFKGATSQLSFITPYFDQIDSLNGNYRLELGITGTFESLVRTGWMEVQNGRAEFLPIENPLSAIEGRIVITDNELVIAHLTAQTPRGGASGAIGKLGAFLSRFSDRGRKSREASFLEVSGSMDMQSFFNPDIDMYITGENVYFATPLREIEAVGSLSLHIAGQDTIQISGQYIPEPGALIIKREMTGPELYMAPEQDDGALFIYNISVPFYGGAVFRSSEINAEVEGEITLTASGAEEFRYAGNIEIVSGEFDYNGYNFSVIEGSVLFEPSEFNPQFYIRAVTDVEMPASRSLNDSRSPDLEISLTMSGKLDEPNILFESNSSAYTQSDLLQLFALGNTSVASTDPTATARWSLGNMILREIEQDAQESVGLDRLKILTGNGGSTLPGETGIRIQVGKRLTSRLYVGIQADPTLSFNQYQYRVAYRLNRNMTLEGSVDPNGLYQVNYRVKYRY